MTTPPSSPQSWSGHWITAGTITNPDRLHRVAFQRTTTIEKTPTRLPVRITADSRYVLWVNGTEVGRGPARSQPERWTYDQYDIAPFLITGANKIAVLVSYYAENNTFWQHPRVSSGLGNQATLLIDADDEWSDIRTDQQWTAAVMAAWESTPLDGLLGALPIESVDHRLLDWDWITASPAQHDSPPAVLLFTSHPGAIPRSQPPAYPYGTLVNSDTPPREGPLLHPVSSSYNSVEIADPGEPITGLHEVLKHADLSPTSFSPQVTDRSHIWQFDMGRVVSGFAEVDIAAPEGSTIDIVYLERDAAATATERYLPRSGARFIAGPGTTSFRALEPAGFRYAVIRLSPAGTDAISPPRLRLQEHLARWGDGAVFESRDNELNALWHAGIRTVHLNSVDAFTDCPTREQRAWVGDAVVHAGVHLVANTDWRLVRRHLELSASPRPDGLLPMSVAGDIEAGGRYSIPDWSLHWVHALWLYARSTGDESFIRRHLPTVHRVLAWFDQFQEPDGTLARVTEWALVDWSSVFVSEQSSILTALWARGLREYSEMSTWLENPGNAEWANRRYEKVRTGFETFWDPARSLYVDHATGGVQHPATSQAGNAAAIVAGLVPAQRLAGIVSAITDEDRLVTRGWNAASPTVPLTQKITDRGVGVQRIDWNVDHQIVRAEPFFSSVVHDAIADAGRADLLPHLLKRWSRFLHDGYDTFGECWEWGSPCHGWSSTPTRDLITHVLGAQPPRLGKDHYLIAPARADIDLIRASVPTRAGMMHLELNTDLLTVTSPIAFEVHTWDGKTITFSPGTHTVPMSANGHNPPHTAELATEATR